VIERYVAPASSKHDAIRAIYAALEAPEWAAPNLDGLIDILRDLSWLPPGPVVLHRPAGQLPDVDERAIAEALAVVAEETAETDHPVRVRAS
jgi:hypothetical protein